MSSPQARISLKLDWCSYDAALYACKHWHYSGCMPASKLVKIGVWENGQFIGAVIYGRGANQWLGNMMGLSMLECCELCRVALRHDHRTPVSRIVAISLRMLKSFCPGVAAVVSYADCDEGHHGGIYAAGGWVYLGKVQLGGGTPKFRIHGKVTHGRSVHARYGAGSQKIEWLRKHVDPRAEAVYTRGKHKYVMPFISGVKALVLPLAQPYPKREDEGDYSATSNNPAAD